MFFFSIFLSNIFITTVHAESFYEAEYISDIYMNKHQVSTNTTLYQQARVFRESGTNKMAFCLEPFRFFDESKPYSPTITPRNLTPEQIDRISKIAHFGHGYKDHITMKWYAITQMMIWQAADPINDYYFTDVLNGNRINLYQNEIQEVNNLIREYETLPSFNNTSYTIVEGNKLIIEDHNNVISSFKSNDINLIDNRIILDNLRSGEYTYTFTKQDNFYNHPTIFYQSNESQNLMETGDLSDLQASFKVKVMNTKIELSKIDKDTQSTIPTGEASLDGAIYKLYDTNDNLINTFTIKDNQAVLNNLNFGKYYLIEDTPGVGYTLDTNKYEINLTEDNPIIQLVLENKVIEKEITIEKKYGDNNNLMNEQDISFNIFNNKNELIDTVITNEHGIIELKLPYGKYKVIQLNSKEGYSKVEPFTIEVNNTTPEKIELKDLRIPVPNTHTSNKLSLLQLIFQIIIILL